MAAVPAAALPSPASPGAEPGRSPAGASGRLPPPSRAGAAPEAPIPAAARPLWAGSPPGAPSPAPGRLPRGLTPCPPQQEVLDGASVGGEEEDEDALGEELEGGGGEAAPWSLQEKALHEARLKAKAKRRLRRTSSRDSHREAVPEKGEPEAEPSSPKGKNHDRKSRMGKGRGLPKKGTAGAAGGGAGAMLPGGGRPDSPPSFQVGPGAKASGERPGWSTATRSRTPGTPTTTRLHRYRLGLGGRRGSLPGRALTWKSRLRGRKEQEAPMPRRASHTPFLPLPESPFS